MKENVNCGNCVYGFGLTTDENVVFCFRYGSIRKTLEKPYCYNCFIPYRKCNIIKRCRQPITLGNLCEPFFESDI